MSLEDRQYSADSHSDSTFRSPEPRTAASYERELTQLRVRGGVTMPLRCNLPENGRKPSVGEFDRK